jgi:type II secretory pathway pseudopilin PulG
MRKNKKGFTRLELLVAATVVGVLGMIQLSALGSSASRARLSQCFNNLRQVGIAYHQWTDDHPKGFPWDNTMSEGGTRNSPAVANAFIHFSSLSNQLAGPTYRILVCPSDSVKREVESPDAFLSLTSQNNALSYIVGLHGTLNEPQQILSGDRHLRVSTGGGPSCARIGTPAYSLLPGDSSVAWTNAVHGRVGNLLLTDGAVHTVTSEELRESVSRLDPTGDDGGPVNVKHVLIPTNPSPRPEEL